MMLKILHLQNQLNQLKMRTSEYVTSGPSGSALTVGVTILTWLYPLRIRKGNYISVFIVRNDFKSWNGTCVLFTKENQMCRNFLLFVHVRFLFYLQIFPKIKFEFYFTLLQSMNWSAFIYYQSHFGYFQ